MDIGNIMGGPSAPKIPETKTPQAIQPSPSLQSSLPATPLPQSTPMMAPNTNSLAGVLAGAPQRSPSTAAPVNGFNPTAAMELLKRGGY